MSTSLPPCLPRPWPPSEEEWRRLEAALARVELENKLLREQVRLMLLEKYGPKSEQLTDAQLQLLEEEPGVAAAEVAGEAERTESEKQEVEKQRTRRSHPGRAELPAHLPRREHVLSCAPEQCCCAQCQAETVTIGYEVSEELDVEPAVYFVKVTRREKRACRQCPELGVRTALAPAKIIEKSKASNRLIIQTIIAKYLYHLPLYRQSALMEREAGIDLSRATLCGWVTQAGDLLTAVVRKMRVELLAGGYIQADETPVGVQSDRTQGRNHQGYFWEYSRPRGNVIFDFQMGRAREGPRQFLGDFGGILQSDGYGAYAQIGGRGLIFAGCMAHARRGFVEALKVAPGDPEAELVIAEIAKLYAVESQARAQELSPEARRALRQSESLPVLKALQEKLLAIRQRALPKSALGKACQYALQQWPRLLVYAEHGEVEIDQNLCENAIRPIALGRKNWLHVGSEEAGPRVAAIMSVIETTRRLGIDTRAYLEDVLPKLSTWPESRVVELTPMAWARHHAA